MNTTTLNMTTLDGGVIIKKGTAPAPPSGGESGADEWQYYDVRNNTLAEGQWEIMMTMYPTLVAIANDRNDVTEQICGAGILALYGVDEAKERLKYIAIDMDVKQYGSLFGNQPISFKEYEVQAGQSLSDALAIFGITPITKEQFYSHD